MEATMDARINNLNPGQSIEISNSNGKRVTCERSGNGEVIRFVRHDANGWQVIRTRNFNARLL